MVSIIDFGKWQTDRTTLAMYTSFDSEPDFQLFGFDEQENKIRDLIFENSYKAIGVYGMAGSGKTSLILKVLNSPTFQNHHFSPIIWLCLSDINSKEDAEYEVNIVKFILCELGCDVDKWTVTNPTKADLLKHLKKLLMSKKYLIVFDDAWENNEFYSNLGDALPGSDIVKNQLCEALPRDGGGKIIITSRQKEVVKNMVGEKNLIPMKPLSRETCRMILEDEIGFNEYAKEIEGLLSDSGFVSIGIYGPSSSANTVLVRKVLSNPSVGEMFEHIIWVPVSLIFFNYGQISEFQDSLNVLNEIMKHVLKGLGIYDNLGIYDRDFDLRQIVKESLVSRKYLIVLADVVQDNYNSWGLISSAWPKDGVGTVIVTTKIRELAEGMVGDQILVHVRLPDLGNEGNEVGIDHHYISDAIVDQCCGLPLAVKTLAKIIWQKGLLPDSYPLRHPNSYSHPYPLPNPHSYWYLNSDRRTGFG
ncbi:disease resistance RPP13-like protein 4 [Senna tora]|uniref:Disease resistance RPP13-like protein 4 n=1 Tax=Senna tora TaxID=362788 RepID=A0A835CL72_9FABA|nr:disease resistance RPP13-like protein 4 [Senna tora]